LKKFDVVVIGGGHAGIEAAAAAARTGADTLLLSLRIESLGEMSCNPSIGGQGKGQIVREVDVLGGLMGRAADFSAIQYRILNRSKGEAVRATRSQNDRRLYRLFLRHVLFSSPRLILHQEEAIGITTDHDGVSGVLLRSGDIVPASAAIITAGTFLRGRIIVGGHSHSAGRLGEPAANDLSSSLLGLGLRSFRFKTGTPVRLLGRSISFSLLEEQQGEEDYMPFSVLTTERLSSQLSCHVTYTTERTHAVVLENLHSSPLYGTHKSIEGTGPRYCPSIEDKVVKFPLKERHQIFLEPEGWDRFEYYPNGISTSLPYDVQEKLVRTIPGLEKAEITRPAYAIEYDVFDPRDLRPTLESKVVPRLFLAGQVNGSSGYEEAAIQGLVAGVNASLCAAGHDDASFVLDRDEAYGGVLIDDIVSRGVDEPYRMFSSRAEQRLFLREDNTCERLLEKAFRFSLIPETTYCAQCRILDRVARLVDRLEGERICPSSTVNAVLADHGEAPLLQSVPLAGLLRRPTFSRAKLAAVVSLPEEDRVIWDRASIRVKYAPYLKKENEQAISSRILAETLIPAGFSFQGIPGLSREIEEKLSRQRPESLLQASRIPGVTPAAIAILLMHIKN